MKLTIILCTQIEKDAADLAVSQFGCTFGRMTVVLCLPGITYQHYYWWTRLAHTRAGYKAPRSFAQMYSAGECPY